MLILRLLVYAAVQCTLVLVAYVSTDGIKKSGDPKRRGHRFTNNQIFGQMTTTAPPSSSSSGFSKYLRDFGEPHSLLLESLGRLGFNPSLTVRSNRSQAGTCLLDRLLPFTRSWCPIPRLKRASMSRYAPFDRCLFLPLLG